MRECDSRIAYRLTADRDGTAGAFLLHLGKITVYQREIYKVFVKKA